MGVKAKPFWDRVKFSQETGACWEWKGARIDNYGSVKFMGMSQRAHRVAYMITKGKIPDGMMVCHTCDNPPCCNPLHLWLGTAKMNCDDMHHKGRANPPTGNRSGWVVCPEKMCYGDRSMARRYPELLKRGSQNGNHKLFEKDVTEIRRLVNSGHSKNSTAKKFGVTQKCIRMIMRGDTWKHLP